MIEVFEAVKPLDRLIFIGKKTDRDNVKRVLDRAILTPGVDSARNFWWSFADDRKSVIVRSAGTPILDPTCKALNPVPKGTELVMRTDVAPKRSAGGRKHPLTDEISVIAWLAQRLDPKAHDFTGEGFGVEVIRVERPIISRDVFGVTRPVAFTTASIVAKVRVTDPDVFHKSLIRGLPTEGRCWGYGMIRFQPI